MTARTPMAATAKVQMCEGVSARAFDGEWIILDLQGGNYFGLDEIGGLVWQHLADGRSPTEISMLLAQEYDAPKETLLQDILRLIDQLTEQHLIKFVGEGAHPVRETEP